MKLGEVEVSMGTITSPGFKKYQMKNKKVLLTAHSTDMSRHLGFVKG